MNTNRPTSSGRAAVAWRHNQSPSRRGSRTSVTTASNGCRSTASNPSTPSSAVTTSQPCCSRAKRSVARTSSSSSTTRTRSLVASVMVVEGSERTNCTNCTSWLCPEVGRAASDASGDVGDAGAARGPDPFRQVPHPGRWAEATLLVRGSEELGDLAAEGECLLRREIAGQLAQQAHELTHVGGGGSRGVAPRATARASRPWRTGVRRRSRSCGDR